jgi:hypothetical protein
VWGPGGQALAVGCIYEVFGWLVELLVVRGRRDRSKDVEILVLRKQLEVLRRQVHHPRFGHRDRVGAGNSFTSLTCESG